MSQHTTTELNMFFTSDRLSRHSLRRKDEAWLRNVLESQQARIMPIFGTRQLFETTDGTLQSSLLSMNEAVSCFGEAELLVFLGEFRTAPVFAAIYQARQDCPEPYHLLELREVAGRLCNDEASLLALARALTIWHINHRFCARCGHITQAVEAGHQRYCTNCHARHFPRLEPAVIVLVEDGPRCLLGREASWPGGRFSTIAGFVEPGETIEAAVVREVFEETGINVTDIRYTASQPWPFPASLMLGFTAKALDTDIVRHDGELEAVHWFTRDQIIQGIRSGKLKMSPGISISWQLISQWFDAESEIPLRNIVEAAIR